VPSFDSLLETEVMAVLMRPIAVEASVLVLSVLVAMASAVMVKSCATTVITEVASALARARMVVPPFLIRLPPLKSALLTALEIWALSEANSSASAARLVVFRPASAAARAFSFICRSRSEMLSPAEIATSTVD
jgi:hypothetical protein